MQTRSADTTCSFILFFTFTNFSKEILLRMVTSTYFLTGIAHEKFLLLYYTNSYRTIQNWILCQKSTFILETNNLWICIVNFIGIWRKYTELNCWIVGPAITWSLRIQPSWVRWKCLCLKNDELDQHDYQFGLAEAIKKGLVVIAIFGHV